MAAVVGKYAANKLLKKQMSKFESKDVNDGTDPYFAMVEDPRHPGKLKKVKKQIPAYIPEHDADVLAAVRRRAYRLDVVNNAPTARQQGKSGYGPCRRSVLRRFFK